MLVRALLVACSLFSIFAVGLAMAKEAAPTDRKPSANVQKDFQAAAQAEPVAHGGSQAVLYRFVDTIDGNKKVICYFTESKFPNSTSSAVSCIPYN